MRGYSSAIRDDVVSIKQLCPITHPRAKRFLRQWGAEKIGTSLFYVYDGGLASGRHALL
jgi:hypothetical protein